MDLYELVKDLIDEAKKQKNLNFVEKLIDIKIAISELMDENLELRKQLTIQQNVVRHEDGPYITLENDDKKIKYCSTCWGNDGKLIQLVDDMNMSPSYPSCPICLDNLLKAKNLGSK